MARSLNWREEAHFGQVFTDRGLALNDGLTNGIAISNLLATPAIPAVGIVIHYDGTDVIAVNAAGDSATLNSAAFA